MTKPEPISALSDAHLETQLRLAREVAQRKTREAIEASK